MDPIVSTQQSDKEELTDSVGESAALEVSDFDGAVAAEDAAGPLLLVLFAVILLAVCWQNWFLARRAEEKSLVPNWLKSWLGRTPGAK